ncbi:MAG: major capsid protein [Lentimicrobium sp.]|nr:major capsid protein [Lentimicrobium sp.]
MRKSLIHGLNEKDMQAVVNSFNLNAFYFPALFPLRFTPSLNWKTLAGDKGVPVAADVVSYDATAPTKTREVVKKLTGDIPKIEIKRTLGESKLNEYAQLLNYAGTEAGRMELVRFIYDDVEFCFSGVNARLEWLALRALSTGKIVLSKANNAGIVTEEAVDFQIPGTHKKGATVVWSAATLATAKPITDIRAIVTAAKKKGKKLEYILMSRDTFDLMKSTTEVINFAANWVLRATGLSLTPTQENINTALMAEGLPQIKIVESFVTLESNDGTRTVVEPWQAGIITFAPSLNVGTTWHGPMAAENVDSPAQKVKRGHVLISKWGTDEPVTENTKGTANAFPAINDPDELWLVDTTATSWSI